MMLFPSSVMSTEKRIQLGDILDTTFTLNYQSFKFIRPMPESMVRYVVDPGLFYTVNVISENDVDIIASTLFDPDSNNALGKSIFEYNGESFKIDTFEVNYDLQNAIVSTNKSKFSDTQNQLSTGLETLSTTFIIPLPMVKN